MEKYEVYGLRRSGNHVIIEWILSHFNYGYHKNAIKGDVVGQHVIWKNKKITMGKPPKADYDVLIESHEDIQPESINPNTIIILRDWYNIRASRIKSNRGGCWAGNCEEIYLTLCKAYVDNPENVILYNKLVVDPEYAKEVEDRFGWNHIPVPTNLPKSGIGRGSSFGHLKGVNDRYQQLKKNDPPRWAKVSGNAEINKHMKDIFGITL